MKTELDTDEFDSVLRGVAAAPPRSKASERIGTSIGRYRIATLIGAGGMGTVYEAHDCQLDRQVAIKFVRASTSDREMLHARFAHERAITAELEHPSIVPVYDSGATDDGEPFYVMRIARGEPLERRILRADTLNARVALLPNIIAVAEAMAFAHSHRIIHRDLKPANILIGTFGETLVADWGLAKRLDEPGESYPDVGTDSPLVTRAGNVLGTPAYMAPEQADGGTVDARSDVYAIGAMLYQLVTGRTPGKSDIGSTEAPADLGAIIAKAIATSPADRYPGAGELANELRRFLAGQIVEARRYTRRELLMRWVLRHRREIAIGGVLGAMLIALAIASVVRIVAERDRALVARRDASDRNDALVLLQARTELSRDPTASLAWLERYPVTGPAHEDAVAIAADARSRGVAHDVWDLGVPLGAVAFSPDGRTLAVGAANTVTYIDVATGARHTDRADDGGGDRVVFSPDGASVITSDGHEVVRVWDRVTGASRRLTGQHVGGANIEFSSDSSLLLVHHPSGGSHGWHMPDGQPLTALGDEPQLIAFVPGRHEVAVANAMEVALVDPSSGVRGPHVSLDKPSSDLRASADGKWIVIAQTDALFAWNPDSGVIHRIATKKPSVSMIAVSSDGRHFMSCGNAGVEPTLFDLDAGSVTMLSGDDRCRRAAFEFSPDGQAFVSVGIDGTLRLHLVAELATRVLQGHDDAATGAAFSPDGHVIASVSADHTVRLWRWDEGVVKVWHDLDRFDRLAADGHMLVEDLVTHEVVLLDLARNTRKVLAASSNASVLSADGRTVAEIRSAKEAWVYDVTSGTRRTIALADPVAPEDDALTMSPDGKTLADVDAKGEIWIVDLATGLHRHVGSLGDIAYAVMFSPDGKRLALAGRTGVARVLDLASGAELARVAIIGIIWNLAFSPDGTRLATACSDGTVRILDVATGAILELRAGTSALVGVDFSDDGQALIAGSYDGVVREWDLRSRRSTVVDRETTPIHSVQVIRGTSWAVAELSTVHALRVWDMRTTPTSATLTTWLTRATTATVDASGKLRTTNLPW